MGCSGGAAGVSVRARQALQTAGRRAGGGGRRGSLGGLSGLIGRHSLVRPVRLRPDLRVGVQLRGYPPPDAVVLPVVVDGRGRLVVYLIFHDNSLLYKAIV